MERKALSFVFAAFFFFGSTNSAPDYIWHLMWGEKNCSAFSV